MATKTTPTPLTPEVKQAIADAITASYRHVDLSRAVKGTPQYGYYFAVILNESVFTTASGKQHSLFKPIVRGNKTITPYCKLEDDALHIANKILGKLTQVQLSQRGIAQMA